MTAGGHGVELGGSDGLSGIGLLKHVTEIVPAVKGSDQGCVRVRVGLGWVRVSGFLKHVTEVIPTV